VIRKEEEEEEEEEKEEEQPGTGRIINGFQSRQIELQKGAIFSNKNTK
jgi:hypothetical protein